MSIINYKFIAVFLLLLLLLLLYQLKTVTLSGSQRNTKLPPVGKAKKIHRVGSPADLRVLFQDRLETLARACQHVKRFRQDQKADFDFNIAPQQKLLMCKTAKHGTTTWSYYFIQIFLNG